ncbi:MAG: class I SAM-dependent methyltransferase [Planctomycetes bacterium]|nr:class I SAM-dependent methyltransferase [Planctomycetota bacterium]
MSCPLCACSAGLGEGRGFGEGRYLLCGECRLISVDPRHHLCREDEKSRYEKHHNRPDDAGYVDFLSRLLRPMRPLLNGAMRGLDYGCGPGPVLSELMRREGFSCEDYDPLFKNRPLDPPYDYILSTECFEHFRNPGGEIGELCALLAPGGLLGIMTGLWTRIESFAEWDYVRDATHISFFHERTMAYVGRKYRMRILYTEGQRVVIFRRDPGDCGS